MLDVIVSVDERQRGKGGQRTCTHERLSERDWPSSLSFLNPAAGKSCEKMKRCVIDERFLHLICPPLAGVCDSSRSQSGGKTTSCERLKVRMSVSVLTSSLWGEEQPDTESISAQAHQRADYRQHDSH